MPATTAADRAVSAVGVRVARLGDDEVVVKRGLAEVRMAAPGISGLLEELVLAADGSVGRDELVAGLARRHEHAEAVVAALLARRILRSDADDDASDRFWAGVAPGEADVASRLRSRTVRVTGTGPLADELRAALRGNGLTGIDNADDAAADRGVDLWCAATEGPADPELLEHSRRALDAGTVFLPVWLDDLVIRVGPLTFPHDTACLRCCLWRLDSTDPWYEARRSLRKERSPGPDDAGHLPSMVGMAAAVAAGEAVLHLAGLPVRSNGRVLEINTVPFAVNARRVLKVPRCPDCSGSSRRGGPVLLNDPQLLDTQLVDASS